jgi:hypothetical protein
VVALGTGRRPRREIQAWLERPASWEEPCRSASDGWARRPRGGAGAFGRHALPGEGGVHEGLRSTQTSVVGGILEVLGYGGARPCGPSLAGPWARRGRLRRSRLAGGLAEATLLRRSVGGPTERTDGRRR